MYFIVLKINPRFVEGTQVEFFSVECDSFEALVDVRGLKIVFEN